MPIIQLERVTKAYAMGHQTLEVLKGITLSIEAGEFLAIMGPSGSGKSTLLHLLGCLDRPTSGTYRFEDEIVSALSRRDLVRLRRSRIGFVFQNFQLLPRMTAQENVALPLLYRGTPRRRERSLELLGKVGLTSRARHRPTELSGGEQQRVAIARALANDPLLILADEPTGNLDSRTGEEILALFEDLNHQGRTIVLVTHEASLARRVDRILSLFDGQLRHAENTH